SAQGTSRKAILEALIVSCITESRRHACRRLFAFCSLAIAELWSGRWVAHGWRFDEPGRQENAVVSRNNFLTGNQREIFS
ncbi:hypothetical protein, partial [Klebsiella pneumoniae]|uniref:hypothetical protein n=1 Tax=Klebsiella pneumoniae TaxID=573 RepID=UPI001BCE4A36